MKSSDLVLLFFILYDFIITIISLIVGYKMKREYNKLDKYNEELCFELVKLRKKCYSKDDKEG